MSKLIDRLREVEADIKTWPIWMKRLMSIDTRSGPDQRQDTDNHEYRYYVFGSEPLDRRKKERRG